jgi:hypothetical protein
MICSDIEMNRMDGMDDHHIFIWDNVKAHHVVCVHETVTNRAGLQRFSIVPPPQYHP